MGGTLVLCMAALTLLQQPPTQEESDQHVAGGVALRVRYEPDAKFIYEVTGRVEGEQLPGGRPLQDVALAESTFSFRLIRHVISVQDGEARIAAATDFAGFTKGALKAEGGLSRSTLVVDARGRVLDEQPREIPLHRLGLIVFPVSPVSEGSTWFHTTIQRNDFFEGVVTETYTYRGPVSEAGLSLYRVDAVASATDVSGFKHEASYYYYRHSGVLHRAELRQEVVVSVPPAEQQRGVLVMRGTLLGLAPQVKLMIDTSVRAVPE